MSKDGIVGKAKEIAGTLEESFGKAIHSDKLAAAGHHTQEAGLEQGAASTAAHAAKKDELKK